MQVADNRPEAAQLRKLQLMANRRTPIRDVRRLFRNGQYQAIYNQLNAFCSAWSADAVAADICGAYDDLAARLGAVGITLGDNAGSRAANPLVRGLWIGEIIDMLHTLSQFLEDATGFLPEKFWGKVETMRGIMGEDD